MSKDPFKNKPNKVVRTALGLTGATLAIGGTAVAFEAAIPNPTTAHFSTIANAPKGGYLGVTDITITGPLNLRTSPELVLNADGSVAASSNNNVFRKLKAGETKTVANGFEYVSHEQAWVGIRDSKAPGGYVYANMNASADMINVSIDGKPANEVIPSPTDRVIVQNHELFFKNASGVQPLVDINLPRS